MNRLQRVQRDYRAAFLHYLISSDEPALHAGYKIGRSAVAGGLSLLDLVRVHHQVLSELVRSGDEPADPLVSAASDFLVEVLASYHMAQRTPEHEGSAAPADR